MITAITWEGVIQMKNILFLAGLSLASAFYVAPSFADAPAATQPEQPDQSALSNVIDAWQNLNKYLESEPKPEISELDLLIDKLKTESSAVYANTTLGEATRQMAYQFAFLGYVTGHQYDAKYAASIRTLAVDCRKTFAGSNTAALGDALVFQLDAAGLAPADALVRLEAFSKDYPKSSIGPNLVLLYSDLIEEDYAVAKKFVADSLKIFPANPTVVEYSALLENVGKPATLAGTTLDGKAFNLADWKGKVVVVNIWASWSKAWQKATPEVLKMQAALQAKGVEFIGVSVDKTQKEAEDYVAAQKIAWPQLLLNDPAQQAAFAKQFGVRSLPAFLVIDKAGNTASKSLSHLKRLEKLVEKELKK
jgi:thiol-disulfide isomerase/thioredoxin